VEQPAPAGTLLSCLVPALRWTVTALVVASGTLAAAAFRAWAGPSGSASGLLVALSAAAVAIGLFRMTAWGRGLAVVMLWGAVLLQLGRFTPFEAGDQILAGREPPLVAAAALRALAVAIPCLVALHLLGKHKARFRRSWW
jgi:hypothetical protein